MRILLKTFRLFRTWLRLKINIHIDVVREVSTFFGTPRVFAVSDAGIAPVLENILLSVNIANFIKLHSVKTLMNIKCFLLFALTDLMASAELSVGRFFVPQVEDSS